MSELINIGDFKTLRKARRIKDELEQVSRILTVTEQSLIKYKYYKSVTNILSVMITNYSIIKENLEKCNVIIENNGKIEKKKGK